MLLGSRERWPLPRRLSLALDVRKPTADEQRALWRAELGPAAADLNGHVDRLVAQFNLDWCAISAAATQALSGGAGEELARELGLSKTCRKLGLSFFAYLGDRLGPNGDQPKIPPLADLIIQSA